MSFPLYVKFFQGFDEYCTEEWRIAFLESMMNFNGYVYVFFFKGDLFVLVFSMDSRESFEEVVRLREQILETKLSACASANSSGSGRKKTPLPRVPMVIVGNKCDKDMR